MSSEVAITVRNVSKIYRIYERPEHRLMQMATLGRIRRFGEFSALKDVSFDMYRGETVGIVGRNGCGKSTLLQIICGTLQPSIGSVSVKGRIAALLELGAGFNGEFTGRENVYMNGAILGLSRQQMDDRFEDIARFASIGDFIERPVKTYSSGMFVRLAFAVATAVEPDILVVDEALAVGDEAFQRKCFSRIEAIKERGGTILFVSHAAQSIVQLCDRAVLLDAGEKLLEGEPHLIVSQYQRLINLDADAARTVRDEIKRLDSSSAPERSGDVRTLRTRPNEDEELVGREPPSEWFDETLVSQSETNYEDAGAIIRDVRLMTCDGRSVNVVQPRCRYRYVYDVDFTARCENVGFGMMIKTVSGLELAGATSIRDEKARLRCVEAGAIVRVEFEFETVLAAGVYFVNAGVLGFREGEHHYLHRRLDVFAFRVLQSERTSVTGQVDTAPLITIRMQPGREDGRDRLSDERV